MINAIIFDMDGLMIDSERITYENYVKECQALGYTMTKDFYVTLLGCPAKDVYAKFNTHFGKDFPTEAIITKAHQDMEASFIEDGVPLKEGLIPLLIYLKSNNYKTIVATSSNRDRVDRILSIAKITDYFDDSICGDEVKKGKPNPDIFIKACHKLGVKREEAIVLEDSEAGIQAAYNAHIPVICIPDMKYPEHTYASMITRIYPTLNEVITYLKEENK